MNRSLWLRFFVLALLFALFMTGAFLVAMRQLNGRPSEEIQRNVYRLYATIVEERPYQAALERALRYRWQNPPIPLQMWVIDQHNLVLAGSGGAPPAELLALPRPDVVHGLVAQGHARIGEAGLAVVRLDSADKPAWLLIRHQGSARNGMLAFTMLFVGSLLCAAFFGLFTVALYLRGRSAQARRVIADLQAGRLDARFKVSALDAAGGLMLDFNRMADEIERLFARLESIERTRRELLQELGHDLRTPLTSVRTAADTLALHGEAMTPVERAEFHALIAGEADYLARLMEDLFFIASIDAPSQRQFAGLVDLGELLAAEQRLHRRVQLQVDGAAPPVNGDPYLLARLLRNLFDNAARHASSVVQARLAVDAGGLLLRIEDDGAGMTAEQQAQFGKRRSQRGAGASLGLGSVIAAKIVALHGGRMVVARSATLGGTAIALHFSLPPSRSFIISGGAQHHT